MCTFGIQTLNRVSRLPQCCLGLSLALLTAACGSGGGDASPPEADSRGNPDWQQFTVAQLPASGLATAELKAIPDSHGDIHFVYFTPSTDEAGRYELQHLEWDAQAHALKYGGAPSTIIAIDNSADVAVAISAEDALMTAYRGGESRECNEDVQSDTMFSVHDASVWNEYTAAIGQVERNPALADGLAGGDVSIAVDSAGTVHVAYQFFYEGCDAMNFRYPDLKYVRKSLHAYATDASEQTVEGNDYGGSNDQNSVGAHNAMLLDSEENPAIFYAARLSNGTRGLRVARFSNGGWQRHWIETGCDIGGIAAARSDTGVLGVAYHVIACDDADEDGLFDTHALRYADNASGNWLVQTVDDATRTGQHPSLAFDASGLPAIAYYQMQSYSGRELRDLYFARFYATPAEAEAAGGSEGEEPAYRTGWRTQNVAELGDVGLYNSLWFDPQQKAHISSYSSSAATIYLFEER